MHRRILLLIAFFCLPVVCHAKSNDVPAEYFYAVDHKLPLEPDVKPLRENDTMSVYHVVFTSMHGKRVTALLYLPKKTSPPFPVIMIQHGFGDAKDVDYVTATAESMVKKGFAALAIDAEYHGERKIPFIDLTDPESISPQLAQDFMISLRDMPVQTIIDLQRAMDYLDSRTDIDPARTAYIGMSMGAIFGAVYVGLDKRVECAIFLVGGADLVNAFPIIKYLPGIDLVSRIIDPIYYVGRIAPRPVMMINAKSDEIIPKSAADALFKAAGEPKSQLWIDSGHYLPVDKVLPIVSDWVDKNLVRPVK